MRSFGGFFFLALVACVGDSPANNNPDGGKPMGDEGGPCFANFTCNSGLVCDKGPNICRQGDASSSMDGTGTMDGMGMMDGGGMDVADSGIPCVSSTISYWPAENSSNDSVGKLHLTGAPSYVPGKVNQAFSFTNNADLHIVTPALSGVFEFTLEFWMLHTSSQAGTVRLVHLFDMATDVMFLDLMTGESLSWMIKGRSTVSPSSPIALNMWHHIALVWDTAGSMTLWVDGNKAGQSTATNNPFPNVSNGAILTFANDNTGNSGFSGLMDEMAFYKSALGANDLKLLAAGNPVCRLQ